MRPLDLIWEVRTSGFYRESMIVRELGSLSADDLFGHSVYHQ